MRRRIQVSLRPGLIGLAVILLGLGGLFWPVPEGSAHQVPSSKSLPPLASLEKEDLVFLIGQAALNKGRADQLKIDAGHGRVFLVETTIDQDLQSYLTRRLGQVKSPMAALVALDPGTGRVKALVSRDRLPGQVNYALTPAFPAASVFKMVTAAAAMEKGGLTPASKIPFNGRSHTLYKSQLGEKKNKWTRWPSLSESFAKSFNPVFGKLALKTVGPETLGAFAERFGFNQALQFELPAEPSKVRMPKAGSFALAAVGCGFNRETTLSPLHGALMASAVANNGVMMEPTVIRQVSFVAPDGRQTEVYHSKPEVLRKSLSPTTATRMRHLMGATITSGTCRRTFGQIKKDRVLRGLAIGAKTGSINDSTRRYRIDWFVGYARERATGERLALGVVVAHDLKRRGDSSRLLARQAFRYYFDPRHGAKPKRASTKSPPRLKNKPSSKIAS